MMNEPGEGPQREMSEPEYRERQRQARMASASAMVGQMDAVTADQFIQAASGHLKAKYADAAKSADAMPQQKAGPSPEYYRQSQRGGSSRGLNPASAPPTPNALPVPAAIHEQDVEVASLHQAIQELEGRLTPVLSMQDIAGGAMNGASPTPSSIAERIAMNNYTIRGLYAQVRGILDRLHL